MPVGRRTEGWLIGYMALLPGVSILERFVAKGRPRMESCLWRLLVRGQIWRSEVDQDVTI